MLNLAELLSLSVKEVNCHYYRPFTFNNDIALLELSGTLTFDENVRAICAPNPDEDYTGESAIVAGWGNISPGPCKLDFLIR